MKHFRKYLFMLLIPVLMGTLFRPGCRIIVNGTALPGIYDPVVAARCGEMALRSAEEITRTQAQPPFTLVPVLCLQQDTTDETLLYHVLLESFEGVEKLYAVSANGVPVGLVPRIADVIALRRQYPRHTISFTQTYSYPGAESSMEQVRAAMAFTDFSACT